MFDQTWVYFYISIVIFFSLVPIILICSWIARVCLDEISSKENQRKEKYFKNFKKEVVNGTSTSLIETTKLSTQ